MLTPKACGRLSFSRAVHASGTQKDVQHALLTAADFGESQTAVERMRREGEGIRNPTSYAVPRAERFLQVSAALHEKIYECSSAHRVNRWNWSLIGKH